MLRRIGDNLSFSLKVVRRNKLLYLILFLTLSVGIAVNVTSLTFLQAVVIETFPYPQLDRVYAIGHQTAASNSSISGASKANYLDIVKYSKTFQAIGLIDEAFVHARGSDAQSRYEEFRTEYVTQSAFEIAGAKLTRGRPFAPDEMEIGGRNVVIISHRLWQTFFQGSENIIGQNLWIDEEPYRVIGVMDRRSFLILNTVDLYLPLQLDRASPQVYDTAREKVEANIVVRLRDGISPQQAQLDLEQVKGAILTENPQHRQEWEKLQFGFRLQSFRDWMLSGGMSSIKPSVFLLLVLSIIILGLIMANAIILSYGANARRRIEFAIRWCIGGAERDIRWQLVTENWLMFTGAGLLSLVIAKYMLVWIVAQIPEPLPVGGPIEVRLGVALIVVTAVSLLGIVFGYVSTLNIDFTRTAHVLKEEDARSTVSRKTKLVMGILIGIETACVCIVLFGAASISDTVRRIIAIDPGFSTTDRYYVRTNFIQPLFPSPTDIKAGFDRTYQLLKQSNLVGDAAYTNSLPFVGGVGRRDFEISGQPDANAKPVAKVYSVSQNYFGVMGIKLLSGRGFELTDIAEPIAVIDVKAARRDFGREDPVGKSIRFPDGKWMRIVGVVDQTKHFSLNSEMSLGSVYLYDPKNQPGRDTFFVLKLNDAARNGEINAEVAELFARVNPRFRPSRTGLLTNAVQGSVTAHRILAKLMSAISAGALVVAVLGIYGSIALLATARRREMAIRMAFGCGRLSVITLVSRTIIYPVLAGIVMGAGGCVFLSKALAASLGKGVATSGVFWFGLIAAVIVLLAAAFCLRTISRLLSTHTYRLLAGN